MIELIKRTIRRGLRLFGADVHRYEHTLPAVRARILAELAIDLVLDVGANRGQYARDLRAAGYRGRIVSFEPLPDAFAELAKSFAPDTLWEGWQLALGDDDGSVTIHVSENSVSSSILETSDILMAAAPTASYVGSRVTDLARLDSIAERLLRAGENVYLKLDVQGYELPVLLGARQTLERIAAIESELSLLRLYGSQALLHEVVSHLHDVGFEPVWLEKGLIDPQTGRLLQLDGLFVRHR
jgi:FkbM family methyltransferase